MTRVKIAELSCYLPERIVTNEAIEERVNAKKKFLAAGVLEKLFGIEERRFAAKKEQVSDLAVRAALPIVEKVGHANIDLLIFAAASADLIEPATSNIIQFKLGLSCPCMDLKNACNSFVSAMQTASAYIQAGMYENVLIVNGEKLSDAINFDIVDEPHLMRALASFTLGDAGSAALLTKSTGEEGLHYQEFMTSGQHWDLCTIQGGGSMYPRDSSKLFFEGKTAALKDAIMTHSRGFVNKAFKKLGWKASQINHLFTHQVSKNTFKIIADSTQVPLAACVSVFEKFGNTAAASIPLAISCAQQRNLLQPGDKIAIIGLAAGLSTSIQFMTWG